MKSFHTYPKVYAVGHAAIQDLFKGNVVVQEKVDGSQISFGQFGDELKIRSGNRVFDQYPDSMFAKALEEIEYIAKLKGLHNRWTYRGEYLRKPKHNTLKYDRVPTHNIIIFDISVGDNEFLYRGKVMEECQRLGLEYVPTFYTGLVSSPSELKKLLDKSSVLGGTKVEGVVIKNYRMFCADGRVMMGKFVSEEFKEIHKKEFSKDNPSKGDILEYLKSRYCAVGRWAKAVQHMKEAGEYSPDVRNIGPLIKLVHQDIEEECGDEIKQHLYNWAIKQILRASTRGFPQWYKERMLEGAFNE